MSELVTVSGGRDESFGSVNLRHEATFGSWYDLEMPVQKKMTSRAFAAGNVFQIPIDESRFVLGQIVDEYKATLLVAVFGKVFLHPSEVSRDLQSLSPTLLANTLDALLYHGTWPVIFNETSNLGDMRRPEFLMGRNEECSVEDFHGRRLRRATSQDLEKLRYRTVVAPIRVQKAAQALNGVGEWKEYYDLLRVGASVRSFMRS